MGLLFLMLSSITAINTLFNNTSYNSSILDNMYIVPKLSNTYLFTTSPVPAPAPLPSPSKPPSPSPSRFSSYDSYTVKYRS